MVEPRSPLSCSRPSAPRRLLLSSLGLCLAASTTSAQVGTVDAEQKISATAGDFGDVLDPVDLFGESVAALGDLDGDGVEDLAVGAANDGTVWILFLNADGTVKADQKIGEGAGGFGGFGVFGDGRFGTSVAAVGDLDGDGNVELAVGAPSDDEYAFNTGAVWILFLNPDGTVAAEQKIAQGIGGFGGPLDSTASFGASVAGLGDLDGNGVEDLAVGAILDDEPNTGAVWILFMNPDGTVDSEQKISETAGGFGGDLDLDDYFGSSVAALGDLDGDSVGDLAVGARFDDDGGMDQGAVWILFMNMDGTVAAEQKISETTGGLGSVLDPLDEFGFSSAALGDLDNDTFPDLVVGAYRDDDGTPDQGAAWILFLNPDGTVDSKQKISETEGGFGGVLLESDFFGSGVAVLGDLDNDGVVDLAVGAEGDDDGGNSQGAAWVLFLNSDGTVDAEQLISETAGGFGDLFDANDEFGTSVAALGDLDGNGVEDIAVGAPLDDDAGGNSGAVWILFLNSDGTVALEQKIGENAGGFGGVLADDVRFGSSLAVLDDLDGDDVDDLAVGAQADSDGGLSQGAVWILFLNADGTVKAEQKISETQGNFGGVLDNSDLFGWSVASLGDLDGDLVCDLAVGALLDDDGDTDQGAVWILFLNPDGTVKAEQKISATTGNFGGDLEGNDRFGASVAALGDLDGDDVNDLAVGAHRDDDGDTDQGAVWILFLNPDGTVEAEQKISATTGDFGGDLDASDEFGFSVAALGDLDFDGVPDLAVGADLDDDGGTSDGAVWILFLNPAGTVASEQKISETAGGFGGFLAGDLFGTALAALGDIDGDGTVDLAVGAPGDNDGDSNQGAVWVLFLEPDAIAPAITCPGNQMEECTGPAGAVVSFSVSASDDHDPAPSVMCVPPSGSTFPMGTTTVNCTAMDDSGNTDMCSFDVIVEDTTAPLVTCPDSLLLECTNPGGEVVTYSGSATDACDPSPALLYSPPSGSTFLLGTTPVTVTATDDEGNSSMCTFDVTILDTTEPTLSCPLVVNAIDRKLDGPGEIVFFPVTAGDACDATPSVVCLPPSGSFFPRGTTLVLCTASDDSGNQTICVFPVVVRPTTSPRRL